MRGAVRGLWVLSLILMLSAAVYQRLTGPTHPLRGSFEAGGARHRYRLLRSEATTRDARIAVPAPASVEGGGLAFRRLGTADAYRTLPMRREGDTLVADLPAQPPAGKLEYFLTLRGAGSGIRIPADANETVVIRFKGEVPLAILLPHVIVMFLAMLVGLRTGMSALLGLGDTRRLAWITLAGLTVGGLILGPIVQKYAFGAFWTGFPFGYDLTDNKTLVMWGVWLLACVALGLRRERRSGVRRVAVVAAALVMIAVYLIPHSMRGSQLDYEQLDRGVDPADAIRTG